MARIEGIARSRTLVTRLAFFLSRRSYGRVITTARVYALDSGLLLAIKLMEEVQERAKQTSAPVKQLAGMLVAWRIAAPGASTSAPGKLSRWESPRNSSSLCPTTSTPLSSARKNGRCSAMLMR